MPEETSAASSSASMEEKPCSSTVADSSIDVTEEAKKLIGTGNRHLVMGDVVSAVNVFQEACGMLAARYGDTAEECGEAFFLCGKSLLDLARMENTVLGNALEGVPESDEEEKPESQNMESANNLDENTRDELRRQVYEAMAEDETPAGSDSTAVSKVAAELESGNAVAVPLAPNGSGSGKGPGSPTSVVVPPVGSKMKRQEVEQVPVAPVIGEGDCSASSPCKESADDDKEVFATEEDENAAESGEDDDDGGDDDDDEDEANANDPEDEDVGNLQLAWEMLEVAKFIYKKKENMEDQLMAAQAYLKLGEVSAESGNYPQALEDFQECLALQLKHLPPHSRLLAESNYHLAMTLCYMDEYSRAIEHYNSAITVIENRLVMLQKVIDAAMGAEAADEKTEQEELRQLLPDITEKVADAKESQRTASLDIKQTVGGTSTSSAFPGENGGPSSSAFASASQISTRPFEGASSSKLTSDISHLVRKKRKTDVESQVKDADAKQSKQDATVNGSGDSSANGNGVQEKEPAQPSASESSA